MYNFFLQPRSFRSYVIVNLGENTDLINELIIKW